jgi:tripartite-type tricarboxylate transporter receptor subunit TctC
MTSGWRTIGLAIVMLAGLAPHTGEAVAQTFPSKTVKLVVPAPAGGAIDTVTRALAQKLVDIWSQQVLVENRAGAGGNIGADVVAKAAPDGHTLLVTIIGLAISPSLYKKLPFDPIVDFAPVTQLVSSYTVLAATPDLPANSFKELVALAKAKPGTINYGSTGIGFPPHLYMEQIKLLAGIDIVHIPYKGDAEQIPALIRGEVQVAILPTVTAVPHIRTGRLRALAITSQTRKAALPDVPPLIEAGLPGYEAVGWIGVFAPAKTPHGVVQTIQKGFAGAVHNPDIKERWPSWGYEPVASLPEQFAARFKDDVANFAKVIKTAGIPLQE